MKNSSFHINAAPTAHSFWETRRVWFSDVNTIGNSEAANEGKGEEEIRLEEGQKEKNEIREKLKEALDERNEDVKKVAIQNLQAEFGEKAIRDILEEDKSDFLIAGNAKTHESVIAILEKQELETEQWFQEFIKGAHINNISSISEKDIAQFLAIDPQKAIQIMGKNSDQQKKYFALFQTLSSKNPIVKKWVLSYVEKQRGYNHIPLEIRAKVISLHQESLGKKSEKVVEIVAEKTKRLSMDTILQSQERKGENTELELLKNINAHFNDDALSEKLRKIAIQNTTEHQESLRAEILETVFAYLMQKHKENSTMTIELTSELQKDYEVFYALLLKSTEGVVSSDKLQRLQGLISETKNSITQIHNALTTGSRNALITNEKRERTEDANIVDDFLANFSINPKKSFGETMIGLQKEYNTNVIALREAKQEYQSGEKNLETHLANLLAKGIRIEKYTLKTYFRDTKNGDCPVQYILSLEDHIPPSKKHISLKQYAPYIKNPLQHTQSLDSQMLKAILEKSPSKQIKYLYSQDINNIGAEAIADHLESTASELLNALDHELKGESIKEVWKNASETLQNKEVFERIYQQLSTILKETEQTLSEKLTTEPKFRAEMIMAFRSKKPKIPTLPLNEQEWKNGASGFLQEMKDLLKDADPTGREDLVNLIAHSAENLENIILRPWKNKLSEVQKYSQHPTQWKELCIVQGSEVPHQTQEFTEISANLKRWKENIEPQHSAFSLASRGEGFSVAGMKSLQKLLSQKTKKGDPLIIIKEPNTAGERVVSIGDAKKNLNASYNIDTEQIEIPRHLYEKLQNYTPERGTLESFRREEIIGLWHEVGHLLTANIGKAEVENLPHLAKSFTKALDQKVGTKKAEEFLLRTKSFITGDASNEEELCVMVFAGLQQTKEERASRINPTKDTPAKIVHEIIEQGGEEYWKNFFGNQVQTLIESRRAVMPQYFDTQAKKAKRAHNQDLGEIDPEKNTQEPSATLGNSSLMSGPVKEKKLQEYQAEVNKLQAKITDIREIVKKTQNLPKALQGRIEDQITTCNAIMKKGQSIIQNENLTEDQASSIITQLTKRKHQEDDNDKKVEKKDNTSVEGVLNGILKAMTDFPIDERSGVQKFWNNVEFLALDDFKAPWSSIKSYIKQRWKDQQSLRQNKVFKTLIPKWGWLTGLENEFSNAEEGSRSKIVKKYADGIANEENSYVSGSFIPNVTNPEALLAGVQHLCKGGNMKWTEPVGKTVAAKLQAFGSGVKFYDSDFKDELVMRLKFKKAFYRVYDKETLYDKLYTENKSANESAVEKGIDQVSKLTYSGSSQIQDWIRQKCLYPNLGKDFYVKGQTLEGFIMGEFLDGNFESPSHVIYYMTMGIAQGVIGADAWARAWGKVGSNPLFNFLNGKSNQKSLMIQWQKEILWDEQKQEFRKPWDPPPPWFDAWLDKTTITNDPTTATRVLKMGTDVVNYDHDNTYLNLSHSFPKAADAILRSGHGGEQQPTRFNNIPAGTMRVFTSFALNGEDKEPSDSFIRHAGYYSGLYGLGVLDNKERDLGVKRFQYSHTLLSQTPRGTGQGYSEGMTINDYFLAQNEMFLSMAKITGQEKGFAAFLQLIYAPESRKISSEVFGQQLQTIVEGSAAMQDALKNVRLNYEGRNSEVFSNMVPAVLEYFLKNGSGKNPPYPATECEKNYKVMIKTIDAISSGEYNADWANKKDMRVASGFSKSMPSFEIPPKYQENKALVWKTDGSVELSKKAA